MSSAEGKKDVVSGKLNVLANRFDGFQDALDAEQTRKAEELDKRFDDVQRQVTSLDHSLKLESKNNKASMAALKAWLEDRFQEFHKSVVDPMNEQFQKMNARCDQLQGNIDKLAKKQAEDLKVTRGSIKDSHAELNQKIDDFKRKFEEAMEGISENRKKVELQLLEQERKLLNQLKEEKASREKSDRMISDTLASEEVVRAKGQKTLTQDLAAARELLASKVQEETLAREQGDEKLVKAIAHYTAALQDAIKKIATDGK
eukprot:CAMPEP_0184498218 /NCGR_PEP_ID=MMETSP0113_2-20130426/38430_1 /TAXON_ID=91329 /ORGANISM="Norrisiella sphaerica, Strain BC52" /LENGTH=258 /DNA_ID=CAMNT_0026885645 /DNA_START=67 /DNA_END=843 /DNA_ORIENTATION=-